MNACYTINRPKKLFRIFNNGGLDYPLEMVQELKMANDLSYQEIANQLLELDNKEVIIL